MVIFHSYVKLPEGNPSVWLVPIFFYGQFLPGLVMTFTVRHGLSMALIEIDGLPIY